MGLHWPLIWAPAGPMAVSKGIVLTLDLRNLACSRGHLAVDMGLHLGPGAMVSGGLSPLALDLQPLALGVHRLLIWIPCLLHGAPLVIDLGTQPAPGAT